MTLQTQINHHKILSIPKFPHHIRDKMKKLNLFLPFLFIIKFNNFQQTKKQQKKSQKN